MNLGARLKPHCPVSSRTRRAGASVRLSSGRAESFENPFLDLVSRLSVVFKLLIARLSDSGRVENRPILHFESVVARELQDHAQRGRRKRDDQFKARKIVAPLLHFFNRSGPVPSQLDVDLPASGDRESVDLHVASNAGGLHINLMAVDFFCYPLRNRRSNGVMVATKQN